MRGIDVCLYLRAKTYSLCCGGLGRSNVVTKTTGTSSSGGDFLSKIRGSTWRCFPIFFRAFEPSGSALGNWLTLNSCSLSISANTTSTQTLSCFVQLFAVWEGGKSLCTVPLAMASKTLSQKLRSNGYGMLLHGSHVLSVL